VAAAAAARPGGELGAHHWPRVSGLPKKAELRRMDRNWRVVMMVAKVRAPKDLIVYEMQREPGGGLGRWGFGP
jgi:hypothetical protein